MAGSFEGFTALLEEFRTLADSGDTAAENGGESYRYAGFSYEPEGMEGDSGYTAVNTYQFSAAGEATFPEPSTTNFTGTVESGGILGSEYGTENNGGFNGRAAVSQSGSDEVLLPPEHMHGVGQSLPELTSELVNAQNTQHVEVTHREETLRKLKVELHKEKEHFHSIERDICAAAKSICLSQDEAAQTGLACDNLEKEIAALVSETQGLRFKLRDSQEALESEGIRHQKYQEKMTRHQVLTEEAEQYSHVQQELLELQRKIDELKERRCGYMQNGGLQILSGERQRECQEQIAATDATRTVLEWENREMQRKVQVGRDHTQQLRRDVEMAKKRHQAQLTRLHRQLQEAQARRRQWGEEAERLRTAVTQLRQKMEGDIPHALSASHD